MKHRLCRLAACIVIVFPATVAADMLCTGKAGAILTRPRCKPAETRLDLASLARQGAAGPQGPAGPAGPAGPVGPPGEPAIAPATAAALKKAAEVAAYMVPLEGAWNAANVTAAGVYAQQLIAAAAGGDTVAESFVPTMARAYVDALASGYGPGAADFRSAFQGLMTRLDQTGSAKLKALRTELTLSFGTFSERASAAAAQWNATLAQARAGDLDALAALPAAASAHVKHTPAALGEVSAALRAVAR